MAKTNTYVPANDRILAPVLIVHLDSATGVEMSGPGEGVQSFGIALRSMKGSEEGEDGRPRIAIHTAFVAKAAKEGGRPRFERWMVGPKGKATLGAPVEGAMCLGQSLGRVDAHLASALYGKVAAYAARVASALAAQTKAA